MAKIVELIETEMTKGNGVKDDPYRSVIQYWSKEGNLLFEIDEIDSKKKAAASKIIETKYGLI